MKRFHDFHTNANWRKCLFEVNKNEAGISTTMLAQRLGFSRSQAYSFLKQMHSKNLVLGVNGIWYPIPISA